MRIGTGYDAHRLAEGRDLILGGVKIPHEKGLLGHSDADALTHAIIDALLGAACKGNIGKLFPDTNEEFKDANSINLLEKVRKIIYNNGYRIVNIDSTIVAQKPKLASYIEQMRQNISDALGIDIDCVSVKAKTEEGMGFTGECLGISAHAVCLLENK